MLLMFVFLGIFSRHFVNRFIYMEIYNFSLCKEVKDNHLNVVAESFMFTCAVNRRIPVSLGLAVDHQQRTYICTESGMTELNQHPGSIHSEH